MVIFMPRYYKIYVHVVAELFRVTNNFFSFRLSLFFFRSAWWNAATENLRVNLDTQDVAKLLLEK